MHHSLREKYDDMSRDLEDTIIMASNMSFSVSENQDERKLMKKIEFRLEQEKKMQKDVQKLERKR